MWHLNMELIHLNVEEAEEVVDSIECCIEDIEADKKRYPDYVCSNQGLVSAYYSLKKQLQPITKYRKWF